MTRFSQLYCLWAVGSIGLAVSMSERPAESLTRLLVIGFLVLQIVLRPVLVKSFAGLAPRWRFIVFCTLLAAVVEGFHMCSMPVFLSLRIGRETTLLQGFQYYVLDLLLTIPAYVVICAVIWHFIQRYAYTLWQYIVLVGLAQTLGDGGIWYFLGAPLMLAFLPYPMTNYHAMNILPFLAVRAQLRPERSAGLRAYLVFPAVIGTYFVCGSLIQLVGRAWGLTAS